MKVPVLLLGSIVEGEDRDSSLEAKLPLHFAWKDLGKEMWSVWVRPWGNEPSIGYDKGLQVRYKDAGRVHLNVSGFTLGKIYNQLASRTIYGSELNASMLFHWQLQRWISVWTGKKSEQKNKESRKADACLVPQKCVWCSRAEFYVCELQRWGSNLLSANSQLIPTQCGGEGECKGEQRRAAWAGTVFLLGGIHNHLPLKWPENGPVCHRHDCNRGQKQIKNTNIHKSRSQPRHLCRNHQDAVKESGGKKNTKKNPKNKG